MFTMTAYARWPLSATASRRISDATTTSRAASGRWSIPAGSLPGDRRLPASDLLGRRLRLSATRCRGSTGQPRLNAMTYCPFAVKANAYWYHGPFWAGSTTRRGQGHKPRTAQDEGTRSTTRSRQAGATATGTSTPASNIFSRGWRSPSPSFPASYTLPPDHIRRQPHASVFVGRHTRSDTGKR